jgi:hypothetical protein
LFELLENNHRTKSLSCRPRSFTAAHVVLLIMSKQTSERR